MWSGFNPGVVQIQCWCGPDSILVLDSILVYGFDAGAVRIRSWCGPDSILVWSGFSPGVVLVEYWLDPSSVLVPVWFSLFSVLLNLLGARILF